MSNEPVTLELRDQISRLPVCITPPVMTSLPNSPINLVETELSVIGGDQEIVGPGRIWFAWLPRAGPRFELHMDGIFVSFENIGSTLRNTDSQTDFQVLVTELNSDKADVAGIINGEARIGEIDQTDSISHVTFGLTNFHHYHGGPVRPSGERLKTWKGRWRIEADPWLITIDEIEDQADLRKQLKNDGGHAIIHAGRIEKLDGKDFTISEVDPIINGLRYLLAFCRGMWCGPVFPTYWKDDRFARAIAPWHLTRWRHVGSWFPRFGPLGALSPLVSRFLSLWIDEHWQRPLRHYIWWYIEANLAASLESAIVKTQTALELMGWLVLVEQNQVISAEGFDNLPASDKMRLLLTHLGIPIGIPAHLDDLQVYARSIQRETGPDVFVFLRNAIVHPSLKKRRRMGSVKKAAKFQATQLGRQYLEFVLLSLLGYQGKYEDRTDTNRWAGEVDDMPWKSSNGNPEA